MLTLELSPQLSILFERASIKIFHKFTSLAIRSSELPGLLKSLRVLVESRFSQSDSSSPGNSAELAMLESASTCRPGPLLLG